MTLEELSTKLELAELVDKCAVAVDKGDYEAATACFTPDAESTGYNTEGKEVFHYVGTEEIQKGFRDLLAPYATPYHVNAQKIFELDGDTAKGTVYCQDFYVVRYKSGRGSILEQGCVYDDSYVKQDGKWLIKSRTVTSKWREER
ncbi:MAG: nuclear transport factor 2 family protein [Clostridia bacterium]|nr:nuclear transport factor 2 family protein [Clostridia bacterium]